jgi:hypothetical protein
MDMNNNTKKCQTWRRGNEQVERFISGGSMDRNLFNGLCMGGV